jgi:hypothetical protein
LRRATSSGSDLFQHSKTGRRGVLEYLNSLLVGALARMEDGLLSPVDDGRLAEFEAMLCDEGLEPSEAAASMVGAISALLVSNRDGTE